MEKVSWNKDKEAKRRELEMLVEDVMRMREQGMVGGGIGGRALTGLSEATEE